MPTSALQASRIIFIGPHRSCSSSGFSEPYQRACDAMSKADTDSVAEPLVQRLVGRVSRLERGGNVVAVAGGREIVIEGVEVRDALFAL
jgi:hypothetical protein